MALVDVLVARVGASDDEGGVHVHVVARKVEGDEALEENGPSRKGRGQEDEQARGGAAIRHHVEDGAEARRLLEEAGSVAVESVEQAGDTVEDGAGSGVQRHVVERGNGEDDSEIACGSGARFSEKLVLPYGVTELRGDAYR